MLQLGKNITSASDQLMKIESSKLIELIKEPTAELQSKINQLRTVITIDPKKYQQLKVTLPYFTCGIFNPAFRKTDNFAAIDCFVIDIDHITSQENNLVSLKEKFISDDRVHIVFASPSNDGLKLLFRLEDKCYDHAQFSMFYKLFIKNFADQYGLNQIIDKKTSDVTRACFLSVDKEAWYNQNALYISIPSIINFENTNEIEFASELVKEAAKEESQVCVPPEPLNPLSDDCLIEIRKKLNPNIKRVKEKNIFVPEQLGSLIALVYQRMGELGITVKSIDSINYGKKIRFEVALKWAEINLFYGKKGVSVVKTPKTGSNTELCEICYLVLCELFI